MGGRFSREKGPAPSSSPVEAPPGEVPRRKCSRTLSHIAHQSETREKVPAPAPSTSPVEAPPRKLPRRNNSRKFSHIADLYENLGQVEEALRQAGLESSNLIVGIDFTKSNEWTGHHSFCGQSLHAIGDRPNPYEQAISIIGQTLVDFDDDNLIPCFGFGDASTHDQYVFSFYQDHHPCEGFDDALSRYRQIVPNLKLAGPTSFAPIIQAAVKTVDESGGQYHVLVIIADGQMTRSVETSPGNFSPQERSTIDAIVAASDHPLSIILVGVGDGPWDMMRKFDDNIPERAFDNFQFVNFSEIMARNLADQPKEAMFALAALMEIPGQYKATMELGLLGKQTGRVRSRDALPPPQAVLEADLRVSLWDMGHYPDTDSFGPTSGCASSQGATPPYPRAGYYGDSQEHLRLRHSVQQYRLRSLTPSSMDFDDGSEQVDLQVYGGDMERYLDTNSLDPTTGYASNQGATPQDPPAGYYGDSQEHLRLRHSAQLYHHSSFTPSASSMDCDDVIQQTCPVCLTEKKDMAFGCGHQTCRDCGKSLHSCPLCREVITTRIRLY